MWVQLGCDRISPRLLWALNQAICAVIFQVITSELSSFKAWVDGSSPSALTKSFSKPNRAAAFGPSKLVPMPIYEKQRRSRLRIATIFSTRRALILSIGCALLFGFQFAAQTAKDSQDPVKSVNVFIGTGQDGHTFPGATTPFGM